MSQSGFDKILATRYDNGADFRATSDNRSGIEKPISTYSALLIMSELKVPQSHETLIGSADLFLMR